MNLNLKVKKEATYDAIVVGTGVSGGWAAKELTEKGLKTLVLERGRMVKHIEDYTTAHLNPWELPYGNRLTTEEEKIFHAQKRTGYSPRPADKQWWVNDLENPYTEIKPFAWVRGYHLGGRSITWGRHSYRLSDIDFEANAKDGIAVDWPIRYKDLAPWYDYVESFIGVNGQPEGLPQLPDGKYQPPMELNCLEKHVKQKIAENFSDRILTSGRTANLTQPHHGRGKCQYRDRCIRGCPFGAYFSSLSSTLPAAEQTGNMTIRPFSIVTEVIFDESKNKATGVRVLDAETRETVEFYAPVIFLNASTLGSTFILLNSRSNRFPNGLGNRSGELGHNLMDHHLGVGAEGEYDGFQDQYYSGRRPNGVYGPRFRNIKDQRKDYIRGFGYQGGASRGNW
ncbi:MAG: GMC family oxidoreductase, partial [Bacteroidetes bacterium]|nr:GMC family oxidoreductase [Bacteroidota bacterium]